MAGVAAGPRTTPSDGAALESVREMNGQNRRQRLQMGFRERRKVGVVNVLFIIFALFFLAYVCISGAGWRPLLKGKFEGGGGNERLGKQNRCNHWQKNKPSKFALNRK